MTSPYTAVEIDTDRITDWETFHDVFHEAMGFPEFYGRNMDAWIDCMTSLDEDDRMTKVGAPENGVVVLQLKDASDLARRCPNLYDAIVECTAFVNYRRMDIEERPILCLSYWRQDDPAR